MCLLVWVIVDGVNKEEPQEEFGAEYCAQEPEDLKRKQELPKDFEDGKFNLIL
jgi:hypothetical protein